MITGFCWEAELRLYAAHNPQLKAAVAWYGKLVGDTSLNSPKHPLISPPILTRRYWVYTADRIPVFHRRAWKPCVRRYAPLMRRRKSWSIPMQGTRLMPIIVRATTKPRRKTAGKECWNGSRSTAGKRLTTAHYDVCWAYETGVGVGSTKRHRHVSYALPQHFYIFAAAAGTEMVTTDGSCVFTRVLRQPAHDRCHRIALRQQLPPDIHIRRNVLEKCL